MKYCNKCGFACTCVEYLLRNKHERYKTVIGFSDFRHMAKIFPSIQAAQKYAFDYAQRTGIVLWIQAR